MCLGGPSAPTPPPLPPAPPPPLPPAPTAPVPDPIKKTNPKVVKAKQQSGKIKNQYKDGTGSLKIKLNPNINTGMSNAAGKSGGLNK